jgi:hypothetical protein
MIEWIIGAILVFITAFLVFTGVFLVAIHYGLIQVTPELAELLIKIKFWKKHK